MTGGLGGDGPQTPDGTASQRGCGPFLCFSRNHGQRVPITEKPTNRGACTICDFDVTSMTSDRRRLRQFLVYVYVMLV
jgi:hypothetical protein